jgi:glutamate synthase (NADPH/NADH) small chain
MLFKNNPLSAVCAIVCNHEKQCAGNCIRGRKDTPVHFSSIEAYISDMYLDRMIVNRPPRKSKKAAIIGCGPAGMVVAIKLAKQGYPVTVFEWKGKIGGMLQYGIPEYRLPKSFLERYQARMEEMGITIRTNTTIGAVLMIDNLFRDGYSAVFIGTGAEKPRALDMEGESLGNVHYGLNYLANPQGHKLGDTVAVIGMGNAAMDVARTALRNGSRHVTLYARSKNVTASSSEVAYAELDGAEFAFGMQIEKITEEGPVFKKAIFDENDQIVGYEEEPVQVHADSTIISISQTPRRKLVRTTEGLEAGESGTITVDENYMTTRPGVFAAGDVITGAKTVVHAVDGAKKAAEAMIRYMEQK